HPALARPAAAEHHDRAATRRRARGRVRRRGAARTRERGLSLHSVLRADEQRRAPSRTLRFEGEGHGSGVSLFLVDNEPGEGPGLHRHPYSETWIVRSGRARFTADDQDLEAGDGDILVVGPGTP